MNMLFSRTVSWSLQCFTLGFTCALFANEVRIEKDLAYLAPERKEKADLYQPPVGTAGKYPGIVIIHGGGWTGGVKDAAREINIGTTLAKEGYVCLSIDYQLHDANSAESAWPQNLKDCKTAVQWLRANADKLNLDSENIGVIGGSAGGHLAAMVGVTQPKDGFEPKGLYDGQPTDVKCVVDLYGPNDPGTWRDVTVLRKKRSEAPELYKQFSVLTYIDKDDPPFLIMHGTADKIVEVQQSEVLAEALTKVGVENHLEIIPDAPHTFHLQPKQKDLRPITIEFFNKHLKKK